MMTQDQSRFEKDSSACVDTIISNLKNRSGFRTPMLKKIIDKASILEKRKFTHFFWQESLTFDRNI